MSAGPAGRGPARALEALALGVVLGGFVAMLAWHHTNGFPLDGADESEHLVTCRELALHGRLGVRPADPYAFVGLNLIEGIDGTYHGKHPFGFPLICGLAYTVGGHTAPYLLSPIFGLLAVLGLYWMGRGLGGPVAGLMAAALLATNPLHVGFSLTVMTHATAVAFSIFGALAAWRFADRGTRGAALAAGVLCGAAALTRYGSAMLALPLIAAVGLRLRRAHAEGPAALREALAGSALLVVAGALVYLPLLLHHASAYGSPFVSGQGITESSGVSPRYWAANLGVLVAELRASGLWIAALAGLAGLAALARRRPGLAGFLGAWAAGHFVLYHSFYWRGGVHWAADLRYYLDVFPPLAVAAAVGAAGLRPTARNIAFVVLALSALPLGVVRSVEVARLSRASNSASEPIGQLVAAEVPPGAVVFSDENILHALPYYGDWPLVADAMFHPSFVESYAWLLEDDRPWPVARQRVRRWTELLGGRSEQELAELERRLVGSHLAAGRRVFFVTGGNHLPEWRERLGPAFGIAPRVERPLYWDDTDPRFPSRRLAIYELLAP